jgi:hypothetical protein
MALNPVWRVFFRLKRWANDVLDSPAVAQGLLVLFGILMTYAVLGLFYEYDARLLIAATGLYVTAQFLKALVLDYARLRGGRD